MPEFRPVSEVQHGVPGVTVSSTSTLVNPTGSWKYIRPVYQDRVAPCNQCCPVGIDIEGYMNLLREGRVDEARDLLLRENPLPAVTGRVCYHPCENGCNRRDFDEPVAIHAVERTLGDLALDAPPPGEQVGDAFRTEIMVKLGGKEHTAVFPGGSPAALAPLQAEVQTLIERAKAQGKHGLYRNGKKIEPR